MKVVTYNVNGLRQRVAQHGSLFRLLNSLDADIICFQETKLSRQDLSADLTMAQGYEAFVSCTRTTDKGKICYSGVATFCRVSSAFSSKELALPLAAEEGFTGLLEQSGKRDAAEIDFLLEGLGDVKVEDVLKVDSEGRCIITDHGHFVLINIYGPRAADDNKERVDFKHLFFKILQGRRWESLLHQGKRICVVGDFNIAPASIDCCDAGPDFEENPFRKWLRSLLTESGGNFVDVFREKHPERKEAYTCWPQRVGGEEFNYGTRIDHILIAGQCLHQNHGGEGHNFFSCHVKECDILTQFKRGKDTISRWNGGRSIKLEGSDHVPVYASLIDLPELPVHSTPSLAVRYVPEVRGWQQTIVSLLQKRQVPVCVEQDGVTTSNENTTSRCSESVAPSQQCIVSNHESEPHVSQYPYGESLPSVDQGCSRSVKPHFGGSIGETGKSVSAMKAGKAKLGTRSIMVGKKKGSGSKCFQQTIRSFFQQYKSISSVNVGGSNTDVSHTQVHILGQECGSSDVREAVDSSRLTPEEAINESSCGNKGCISPCPKDEISVDISHSFECEKNNYALLEWQRIQQRMQTSLPLCKGHGEPCVARFVKKGGPNVGRGFYVCARAKGPASNPEANCGYFKWASVKSRPKKT